MLSFPSLNITRINDVLEQTFSLWVSWWGGNTVDVLKFLPFQKETELTHAKKPPSLKCKIFQVSPGTSWDYHPILQMRTLKPNEVKWFAQGHKSGEVGELSFELSLSLVSMLFCLLTKWLNEWSHFRLSHLGLQEGLLWLTNSDAKIKHTPLTIRETGHPCSQKHCMISLESHHDSPRARQERLGHVCVCVDWG